MAARTAHNVLVPGDNYQLFYWANEWVSAGIQNAQYNFLEFSDIPAITLYWLRNLDHGEQEQFKRPETVCSFRSLKPPLPNSLKRKRNWNNWQTALMKTTTRCLWWYA